MVGRLRRSAQALSSALDLFPAAWSPQYPRVTQEYRRAHARTHLGQATGWEGSRQRNEALSESQSSVSSVVAPACARGSALYALSIFKRLCHVSSSRSNRRETRAAQPASQLQRGCMSGREQQLQGHAATRTQASQHAARRTRGYSCSGVCILWDHIPYLIRILSSMGRLRRNRRGEVLVLQGRG